MKQLSRLKTFFELLQAAKKKGFKGLKQINFEILQSQSLKAR